MKNTSGKKTIGLLVGGIIDSFSIDLSKDVMNAASSYDDINLVVIPGRYINRDYSKIKECQYEYQYNTLFCYPKPNNIDGLIIAVGSIGCFTNEAGILAFLEQFKGIDPTKLSNRRKLINTFVNAIYLYDDKLDLILNYQDGTQTIPLSEIEAFSNCSPVTSEGEPYGTHPKISQTGNTFGCVIFCIDFV